MSAEAVFYVLGAFAAISALLCIVQRNPVASALWLVSTMFALAAIYVLLNAQFIAAIQVLVYAGAVMVLFLFVIMLLDPAGEGVVGRTGRIQVTVAIASVAVLLMGAAKLVPALAAPDQAAQPAAEFGQVMSVGRLLFTSYLFPFELASILLLVAMIGAMHMGKKGESE